MGAWTFQELYHQIAPSGFHSPSYRGKQKEPLCVERVDVPTSERNTQGFFLFAVEAGGSSRTRFARF
jgi:hypothetical protein